MIEPDVRRKRAITLLYTITTQNVAWPATIVIVENEMSARLIAERNAIPVTIPGSAIGRITRYETVSLPKKRERATAAAARLPRTSANRVERRATTIESRIASQMAWLSRATPNHFVVRPGGGNVNAVPCVLNA